MNNKLSFEEFSDKLIGGESRHRPGVAVSYILLSDFYAEWSLEHIEDIEIYDVEQIPLAYELYLQGIDYIK